MTSINGATDRVVLLQGSRLGARDVSYSGGSTISKAQPSRPWLDPTDRVLLTLSTLVKALVGTNSYLSTDFEVHRNWLAITRTLPVCEWYFDASSPNATLDYPPFFAWLSWFLALPALLFDPLIVSLHDGIGHSAGLAKGYMRATVVVTELVYAASLLALSRPSRADVATGAAPLEDESRKRLMAASLLLHPGLIIIDHIHFQYNGFLFGILFWSMWAAQENKPLLCALLFSSLLNFKHIYMYVAPAYFVYLLRSYVYPPGSTLRTMPAAIERLVTLGAFTLAPFAVSLLPLMVSGFKHEAGSFGVVAQMLSRMFPFSRGLNHAYWAPNFWALYTAVDRVLLLVVRRQRSLIRFLPIGLQQNFAKASSTGFASASRGLVGNTDFTLLPNVAPRTCFLVTTLVMTAYMTKLWRAPTYKSFISCITLCGFASFLFGWHVHEKAILMILLPLTYLAVDDYDHYRVFVLLSVAGCFSLFPLLFQPAETPIKVTYTALWLVIVLGALSRKVFRPIPSNLGFVLHALETAYLACFPLVLFYTAIIHPLLMPLASVANTATPASGMLTSSAISIVTPAVQLTSNGGAGWDVPGDVFAAASAQLGDVITSSANAVAPAAAALGIAMGAHSTAAAAPPAPALEFLPLMLTSVYCAVGVVWTWVKLSVLYLQKDFGERMPQAAKVKRG
ncbi:glycosyltransferase family 57 protein [Tilletiaria anomala UBC 951]|uniref:Alpha-1,3-glucosyltransferase n=1 Tax=Tilletiaria anomala (strain ATCC 24038 / CBS 436.72 / UBC 951) TaxID=1037660 RepID=A0A066VW64_TILAU|nr:glycosyltransferase family 57 protein [Tilletiaria anomala UBC 951]KDN45947.1 glycosyltransferase family 57 protein [Tilletiaria anomala UBC 951]